MTKPKDDTAPKYQQERPQAEQELIAKIDAESPFKNSPSLHVEYMANVIADIDKRKPKQNDGVTGGTPLKRWDFDYPGEWSVEDDKGPWVRFEDHDRVVTELEAKAKRYQEYSERLPILIRALQSIVDGTDCQKAYDIADNALKRVGVNER